jgi:energy-coupling factor transporter transmembrane protein EcfT
MYTFTNKFLITILICIVFIIVSAPFTYKITNKMTTLLNWQSSVNGCPNLSGLILHVVVFFVIVLILLCLINSSENYFTGLLPNTANMLAVTDLRIEAKEKGCNVDNVIKEAQEDPYNAEKARIAVKECNDYCPNLSPIGLSALANIPYYKFDFMDQSAYCN